MDVRLAIPGDAAIVAALLHDFNTEFATPTPPQAVLAERLRRLLAGEQTLALLAGDPAVGVALLTLRPNVWYDGPVACLDELYVRAEERGRRIGHALLEGACAHVRARGATVLEINVDGDDRDARRFYEAHGFANHEPGETQPLLLYVRDL